VVCRLILAIRGRQFFKKLIENVGLYMIILIISPVLIRIGEFLLIWSVPLPSNGTILIFVSYPYRLEYYIARN